MNTSIKSYLEQLTANEKEIVSLLENLINKELEEAESKIWHAHPVWFLNGNPIVGFSQQKKGIRLMFWSGADFEEEKLQVKKDQKFKDASIFYNHLSEIIPQDLARWLKKSRDIQWDYKNIVKRKGRLEKIVFDKKSIEK
ncbi:MAG: DUF1801 domain-containing protein [Bacteroidota bacterium]|nr:DUF1801 domain-containing protein [Bacteroidota bacterium]